MLDPRDGRRGEGLSTKAKRRTQAKARPPQKLRELSTMALCENTPDRGPTDACF